MQSAIRCALSAAVLLAAAGVASADIVVVDQFTPGDHLAVQDTVSGFRWMRLTSTVNTSVAAMQARMATGGDLEGFSYASPSQIADLFRSAGATSVAPGFDFFADNAGNLAACYHLLDVMGTTAVINGGPAGPGRLYGFGFNNQNVGLGHGISTIMIDGFSTGGLPPFQAYLNVNDGSGVGGADSGMGHFVVMVPTPGSAALLSLTALAGLRRRRV